MIPQFPNGHPVFDKWPVTENYPCPVSESRLRDYQKQIDRIAGKASNGKSNVRVIWTADPAVAMHMIDGEPTARYAIHRETYDCQREVNGLAVVESINVDICAPRFVFEQYHTPEEAEYNPAPPGLGLDADDKGYYTHLFTVAYHDETCCDGRESVNGSLCFGAYQEPNEQHLNYLRQLVQLRSQTKQTRMIGERLSAEELAEDTRALKHWNETRDEATQSRFAQAALDSLKLHGWRMSNTDAGKRSKFHFLKG